MRLSIRYKILGVLGFLLVAAVCSYTWLASFIFLQEKVALLYDINHSIAVNTAAELRSELSRIAGQLKLYVLSQAISDHAEVKLPSTFLRSAHVVGTQLFKVAPKDLVGQDLFVEMRIQGGLPSLGLTRGELVSRLKEASASGSSVWSSSSPAEVPHFFLATRVDLRLAKQNEAYIAVAEIDAKPIFHSLEETNLFRSYLVRGNGDVLVQCDRNAIASSKPIADHPLLKAGASKGPGASGVLAFRYRGEDWYGAYAPVGMGNLYYLSQASKSEVTAALATLVKRSALFGLIVLTLTFIASVLFSKGLTRNLRLLAAEARQIEKGNLSSRIQVSSRDEIGDLASSFNAMATALRVHRDAIEKYNRELEEKVAERTKQLQDTNAAIKEVQEKLLKTTQLAAMGEVAGRTAHEVLNPLTAILSRIERSRGVVRTGGGDSSVSLPFQLTEILGAWEGDYKRGGMAALVDSLQSPSQIHSNLTLFEEDLDNLKKLSRFWQQQTEVVASDLQFVQDQAERIHRIIDRMRELVRSSVKTEVHCHEAVKEAALTMSDFCSKHGVRLEQDLAALRDTGSLNRDEFVQIVTNLIRNSFHAIRSRAEALPELQGKILVRTSSGNRLMVVDVIDNGIGVPETMREQIFEHGFTTKGPSEGTGLGLAICRRYARAFSGEVDLLYSEPDGRGTCFRVTIPLTAENVPISVAV